MYGSTILALKAVEHAGYRDTDLEVEARRRGVAHFWRLVGAAQLAHFRALLRKRSNRLRSLEKALDRQLVCRRLQIGLCEVPLSDIVGSEGRGDDFDRKFRPLRSHHKDRWLNIFGARATGASLPPVDLIQVGEHYFVRDGHHRISVARALGQVEIDALVTVWLVGPKRRTMGKVE